MKRIAWALGIALGLLLMLGLSGCAALRPLLSEVVFEPSVISPNADGVDDVTHIFYRLSRSADVSVYFVDAQGTRHYFRQGNRRSAGRYDVYWGGVIRSEAEDTTQLDEHTVWAARQRVLPDGEYQWVVEAVDDAGRTAQESGALVIQNADTTTPELQGFSVSPHVFTPNQDGIDDRVSISYFLTKPAEVRVNLVGPESAPEDRQRRFPIAEKEREVRPGEVGLHLYDYEGGVDRGADPPADGTYWLVAEVEDRVGNYVVYTSTLTFQEGGVPRADIVQASVEFAPKIVPLGGTVYFTATVENFGSVPIRTTGPTPGTAYQGDQNFNTLGHYEEPGAWRFGIDFETNSTGRPYPYRFAVGNDDDLEIRIVDGQDLRYLLPGQRAVVTGSITIVDVPPRNPLYFWGGLIHEDVSIEAFNDHVDPQQISVGF
ncbi:MAG: hypothetical protein GX605_01335 [Chloroflexi bacterium]|nr:hypothetical protein [Chloroflexota bacterium]